MPPAYRAGTQLAPRAGEEPRALQAWVHCWAQMGPGMAELHGYPLWEARLLPTRTLTPSSNPYPYP